MQIYILGKYFHINDRTSIPTHSQAKSLTDLSNHLKDHKIGGQSPSFEDVKTELNKVKGYSTFNKQTVIDFFNHLFIDELKLNEKK